MQFGIFSIVVLAVAASAVGAQQKSYIVAVHKVEMPSMTARPIQSRLERSLDAKVEGHTLTAECTGTILTAHSVLSTASCVARCKSSTGMPIAISTAEDDTSIDRPDKTNYYRTLMKAVIHPEYDAATNTNNLAILKVTPETPIVFKDNIVSPIQWGSVGVPEDSLCDVTFWQNMAPHEQETTSVTISTCVVPTDDKVCATAATGGSSAQCVAAQDGSALVCGNQLAGVFTFVNPDTCAVGGPVPHIDISKTSAWIRENTMNDGD